MILDQHGDTITCTKCGQDDIIKSGMAGGKQRYQCKNCFSYFVPKTAVSKKEALVKQRAAILLFLAGAQMQDMEEIFEVSFPTLKKWILPAHEMLEQNKDLKDILRAKTNVLGKVTKGTAPDADKSWLYVEIEKELFKGRSYKVVK